MYILRGNKIIHVYIYMYISCVVFREYRSVLVVTDVGKPEIFLEAPLGVKERKLGIVMLYM